MSVSELQQLNQLSSNKIEIGQTLNVSGEASQMHTVQPGDTLYNISNRYDTTVDNLRAQNNLSSNAIQLGQTLQIK